MFKIASKVGKSVSNLGNQVLGRQDMPKDRSGQIARQEEEARQQRIAEGRASIEDIFGVFNDDYFQGFQDDYTGFYMPQLEDQFNRANEKLTLGLAGRGQLESSAGARQLADLFGAYNTQRQGITDQAMAAAQGLRSNVMDQRNQLLDFNVGAADPTAAASRAAAAAGGLQTPPTMSPLGNVFANFLNQGAIGVGAEAQGHPGWNTGMFGQSAAAMPQSPTRTIN